MQQVMLLLGSNLGDSRRYLSRAVSLLADRVGEIVRASSVRTSAPWGYDGGGVYFNQIIVCQTHLEPLGVLDKCEAIERELGRVKPLKVDWRGEQRAYQDRVIDIDILYFVDHKGQNVVYEDERLCVPHPKIEERDFVKVLLDELMLL